MFFASPFFEAALSGNWSETARPPSVVTVSHSASDPFEGNVHQEDSKDPSSLESEDLELTLEFDLLQGGNERCDHDSANPSETRRRQDSSVSMSAMPIELMGSQTKTSTKKVPAAQAIVRRHPKHGPDALIVLKEEKVRYLPTPMYWLILFICSH